MTTDAEPTFLTRQTKQKSSFEQSYLERFGGVTEGSVTLPTLSPQLLKKKQDMEKTNADLEDARTRFEAWKTDFQRKRKELDDKQHVLEIQKANLRSFTEHHASELEKARKREEEEKEQAKKIEADLQKLIAEEAVLREENEKLRAELEELQPCADYLQAVTERSRNFENIESILNRHQTLTATRQTYIEKFQELMSRFGTEEEILNKDLEMKRANLIDRTMQLNDGIARADQIKKINQYRKTALSKDIQRAEGKNAELAQIKSAIQALYNRAVEKSNQIAAKASRANDLSIEQMLQFIENRFNDLNGILNDPRIEYIATTPSEPQTTRARRGH